MEEANKGDVIRCVGFVMWNVSEVDFSCKDHELCCLSV